MRYAASLTFYPVFRLSNVKMMGIYNIQYLGSRVDLRTDDATYFLVLDTVYYFCLNFVNHLFLPQQQE